MSIYNGPSQRVLSRYSGNDLVVDGRRNHLQERAIWVKQKFKLTQSKDAGVTQLNDYWVFEEEKQLLEENPDQYKFSEVKTVDDRMLINKSITKSKLKIDGAHNFAVINTRVKQRLAPYLCSDLDYVNITRKPIVEMDSHEKPAPYVEIQLGAYGRYWFGLLNTIDVGSVTNILETVHDSPFTLGDLDSDIAGGNKRESTVLGFNVTDLVPGSKLRPHFRNHYIGQEGAGQITLTYNSTLDRYEQTEPANIAYNSVAGGLTSRHTSTIPSMSLVTTSPTVDDPYNYYLVNSYNGSSKTAVVSENVGTIADGDLNVQQNNADFIPVKIEHHDQDKQFYMLIPIQRIIKGSQQASIARPIRYQSYVNLASTDGQGMEGAEWISEPALDVALATNNMFCDAEPFWAHFHNTKHYKWYGEDIWKFEKSVFLKRRPPLIPKM